MEHNSYKSDRNTYNNTKHNKTNIDWAQQNVDKIYYWERSLQILDITVKQNLYLLIFIDII